MKRTDVQPWFFGFWRKTPQQFFFFVFQSWFSFKNNRRTNVLLVSIFENALKKATSRQKCHFDRFWQLLPFLSALKKILTKTTFVRLSFLKLKQKKNMKIFLFKVFFLKLLNALFWESNNFLMKFFFLLLL